MEDWTFTGKQIAALMLWGFVGEIQNYFGGIGGNHGVGRTFLYSVQTSAHTRAAAILPSPILYQLCLKERNSFRSKFQSYVCMLEPLFFFFFFALKDMVELFAVFSNTNKCLL